MLVNLHPLMPGSNSRPLIPVVVPNLVNVFHHLILSAMLIFQIYDIIVEERGAVLPHFEDYSSSPFELWLG